MFITSLQELRAPWNEPLDDYQNEEEAKEFIYYAENIYTGEVVQVKEQTYNMLPETEDEAVLHRSNWIQHYIEEKDI